MIQFNYLFLLCAGLVSAHQPLQTLIPGSSLTKIPGLFQRDLDGNYSDCSISDTCSECFGEGYVLCDKVACFDPTDGEQCCNGGSMCVGRNNSCCGDLGPGTPGPDGTISYNPFATPTPAPEGSWTCKIYMTGEECCSLGGKDYHWCAGDFPMQYCYNSSLQECCTDGHICDLADENCCDIVNAKPTTPWLTATATTTKKSTATATAAATTATGSTPSPTTTPNVGESLGMAPGICALAIGVLGGLLFL